MKSKILSLFNKRYSILIPWLCRYYPLTSIHIEKFKDSINWKALSSNVKFKWTEPFIEKHEPRFEWSYEMCKNISLPWSREFIIKYDKKLRNKEQLSVNTGIPWNYDILDTLRSKWNWNWLVFNKSIQWTEKMLVDFNLFEKNLSHIVDNKLWTEEFISKYKYKFCWAHLCYNPTLPWEESFIDEYRPFWRNEEKRTNKWIVSPWKGVSQNLGIVWSMQFIKKYQRIPMFKRFGLHWTEMSYNEAIPFQDGIFEYFRNKWDWVFLSSNNNLFLSIEQIEQNKHKLVWDSKDPGRHTIALNTSLPWSENLIDKYIDRWNWHDLSMNRGIPWSESLISKYRTKLENSLYSNPSLPWSLDFILKYEDKCFDSWLYSSDQISYIIWDTIFSPIINDEFVEEFFTNI